MYHSRSHQDFELPTATFGNIRKSLEHLWQYSEVVRAFLAMFGSPQKFLGNLGNIDTKIARIDLGTVNRYSGTAGHLSQARYVTMATL